MNRRKHRRLERHPHFTPDPNTNLFPHFYDHLEERSPSNRLRPFSELKFELCQRHYLIELDLCDHRNWTYFGHKLGRMAKSLRMAGLVAAMVVLVALAAHTNAARPAPAPISSGDGPSHALAYSPVDSPISAPPVGSPAYTPSRGPSSNEGPAYAPGPLSGATLFD